MKFVGAEEAPMASGGGGADDMLEDMFDLSGNKTNVNTLYSRMNHLHLRKFPLHIHHLHQYLRNLRS